MKRTDDFETRRAHLAVLSDAELRDRFWALTERLVDPLLKAGYESTTPSIERSVLLRMGFSSLEAKSIVDGCMERNLLGHGAGNVVFRLSRSRGLQLRETGAALAGGMLWSEAEALFSGGGLT